MQKIIELAPTVSLVFFFVFFVAVAIWTYLPGNKKKIEKLKEIPLREENGR